MPRADYMKGPGAIDAPRDDLSFGKKRGVQPDRELFLKSIPLMDVNHCLASYYVKMDVLVDAIEDSSVRETMRKTGKRAFEIGCMDMSMDVISMTEREQKNYFHKQCVDNLPLFLQSQGPGIVDEKKVVLEDLFAIGLRYGDLVAQEKKQNKEAERELEKKELWYDVNVKLDSLMQYVDGSPEAEEKIKKLGQFAFKCGKDDQSIQFEPTRKKEMELIKEMVGNVDEKGIARALNELYELGGKARRSQIEVPEVVKNAGVKEGVRVLVCVGHTKNTVGLLEGLEDIDNISNAFGYGKEDAKRVYKVKLQEGGETQYGIYLVDMSKPVVVGNKTIQENELLRFKQDFSAKEAVGIVKQFREFEKKQKPEKKVEKVKEHTRSAKKVKL